MGAAEAERAAQEILARRGVCAPDDIHVERIACAEGAIVAWGETGPADARVVHGAGHARVTVAARWRGTARGRWSIAHELAHWILHRHLGADALDRIHGEGVKEGRDHQYEREADAFASELLLPHALFAPRCEDDRPTVALLSALASEFGTSLTATGKRYATKAPRAACAMLECKGGRVVRAARSLAWRGVAVQGRALEAGTLAVSLESGDRSRVVTDDTWGRGALGGVEMTEHAIVVPDSPWTLVWLWHATT